MRKIIKDTSGAQRVAEIIQAPDGIFYITAISAEIMSDLDTDLDPISAHPSLVRLIPEPYRPGISPEDAAPLLAACYKLSINPMPRLRQLGPYHWVRTHIRQGRPQPDGWTVSWDGHHLTIHEWREGEDLGQVAEA